MKEYNSNYLGITINNNDPEYRGRVQVFIPHLMPALYKDWNEKGEDISISCIGNNLDDSLTEEIVERLIQILPWAEAASPIIGSSSPGGVYSPMYEEKATTDNADENTLVCDQSPTAAPIHTDGVGGLSSLISKTKDITGLKFDGGTWGSCTRGGIGAAKALNLVDPHPPSYPTKSLKNGFSPEAGVYCASDLTLNPQKHANSTGYNPFTTGKGATNYEKPVAINSSTYLNKVQIGDVVVSGGGKPDTTKDGKPIYDSSGKPLLLGHMQMCVGFDKGGTPIWMSDNKQSKFFRGSKSHGSYTNETLYRLTPEGVIKFKQEMGIPLQGPVPPVDPNNKGSGATSSSMFPAAPTPHQTPTGGDAAATNPTTISGGGEGIASAAVSGGGTVSSGSVSPGITKLAAERQSRFGQELNDPQLLARLAAVAKREVGTDPKAQAAFFETVFNRAQFRTPSRGNTIAAVINDKVYYAGDVPTTTTENLKTSRDALQKVKDGSNITMLATDNASNQFERKLVKVIDPNTGLPVINPNTGKEELKEVTTKNFLAESRLKTGNTGNWFKNGVPVSPEEVAKLNLNGKETPAGYEFLYANNGTGGTPEGKLAMAYAKENNLLTSSSLTVDGQLITANLNADPLNLVNNTDGYGPTVVKNTNDMPKGMFTFPNVGSMVWVFFREGNPLYPVYFAASYSAAEWKAAMNGASENGLADNQGSKTGKGEEDKPVKQIANRLNFNPNAGGGMEFAHIRETTDPTGSSDKAYVMIFGDDGSNMLIAKGYHQIYSRHTRRDQIDGDAFRIVGGYEEKWIAHDSNTNVRGNVSIKVGNYSAESIAALEKIASMSAEANAMLASTTDSLAKGQKPATLEDKAKSAAQAANVAGAKA